MMNAQPLPAAIRSERLVLRRPEKQDGRAVYEAMEESLRALREFPTSQPWALAEPSVAASEAFCEGAARSHASGTDFPYLIWAADGGQLLECCGLHRPNWKVPSFEIGYWCQTSMARKGIASEAVTALIERAIRDLGASRVVAMIDERNLGSIRVAEKARMVLEGTLRNYWREPSGQLASAAVYSTVPRDMAS